MSNQRTLHINGELDTYKPSKGFHGFSVFDRSHQTVNSTVVNADLYAGFLAANEKPSGLPWLQIDVVETTFDKNGRSRPRQVSMVLRGEELTALRDLLNKVTP